MEKVQALLTYQVDSVLDFTVKPLLERLVATQPLISEEDKDDEVSTTVKFMKNEFRKQHVPNMKHLTQKVLAVCDRGAHREEHVFHVPKKYHIPGIHSRTVNFQFLNPVVACVELLQDVTLACTDNFLLFARKWRGVYGELNEGNWWRDAERRARLSAADLLTCIMPIVMSTDGACPDSRQSLSLKPISLYCGNFIGRVCRSLRGKKSIAFWPKLDMSSSAAASAAGQVYCALFIILYARTNNNSTNILPNK
jgi:hypothetical protein